jgi:CBS domain-containing protein/mannitol/fructose-specific phosphotransferase system IIA component (Ntr-type)
VKLSELLSVDRVVVPLEATTIEGAGAELLERLFIAGAVSNPDTLRDRMDENRTEDLVAMGDRAFLLHYRTETVSRLTLAMGTAPRPICRQLIDGERQCARVVLLIVAPPGLAARYLQVVGAFARFLSSVERVDALLALKTPDEVIAFPGFQDYELPDQLRVREMMNDRPITTRPGVPLRDAAREMVRTRVSALPVVDDNGLLLGMLSSKDLVRDLLGTYLQGGTRHTPARPTTGPSTRRTVKDVMTRQVLCVSPDQPLAEVASLMSNKDVERVPVVVDGRLVGFLTRGDIVRRLIGS